MNKYLHRGGIVNNNIFETNVNILKSISRQHLITNEYYEAESTFDNNLTFKYDNHGKKIYINSKYDVSNEIDRTFKGIDFNRDSLFIVFGIGMGYHIKELIKRSSNKSRIFVIEKNLKILNTYLRHRLFSELGSEKVIFFFGDEQQIAAEISNYVFNFKIMPIAKNYVNIVPISYYSIYGNWIDEMSKRIIELLRNTFFYLGNDVEDTIIGLKNNFINLKELIKSPSIEYVENKYKDKPAIIVSAGPSLDKNIKELKKAEGKALILATDAVISTLNKNGIKPDAVFTIERGMETYNKFYKDNDIDKKTVFIGPPVVVKEILDKMQCNKKLLCLKKDDAINRLLNNKILHENRLISTGTSCAHVALAFAQYVNANPIIFIGQDLAFSKEGITHSKDVEVKENIDLSDDELLYVKGIDGEMLPTNYAFRNFLITLETKIAQDKSERAYIDATEGGAYKKGMIISTLKEAINRYCNEDILKLYDVVPEENDVDKNKISEAVTELENLNEKFYKVKDDSLKQLKTLEKIEENIVNGEMKIDYVMEVLKQKEVIEEFVFNDMILVTFLQSIIMTSKIKETSLGNSINEKTVKEKVEIDRELMALLLIACDPIIKAIEDIINMLMK